jgi:prepilin-type N-terminal cleavage/methylation domain-containing protein
MEQRQSQNRFKTRRSERGFTLLELSIVAVISLILSVLIFPRIAGLFSREASFKESRQLNNRASTLSNLMRGDADFAGYGLTQPRQAGSGTEVGVFQTVSGVYSSTNGNLVKLTNGATGATNLSRGLEYGNGSFTFTPHLENVSVFLMRQGSTTSSWIQHSSITVGVSCNCVYLSDPSTFQTIPHLSGDSYQYSFEFDNSGNRVLRYYQIRGGTRTLLYTSTAALPSFPVTFAGSSISSGTAISNTALTGAPIIDLKTQPQQLARLPFDGSTRLTSPVQISPDGQSVLFIGGDPDADVMSTNFEWRDAGYGGGLNIKAPARGTLAEGDYVMLVDFIGSKSVLYRVTANDLPSTGLLEVVPVKSSAPAWGRLYSPDSDYVDNPAAGIINIFPKGSRLVKLAPPVEYTVSGGAVMRRELGGPATVVDLGLSNFAVRQTVGTANVDFTYEVSAVLQSEGVESVANAADRATGPVTFTLSPPFLNLTYHQQP